MKNDHAINVADAYLIALASDVAPPPSPKVIYVRDVMVVALGLSLACGALLLAILAIVVIAGAGQ